MKTTKIIYWVTTGIVAGVMLWSAIYFGVNAEMKSAFVRLGLPDWFRIELTIAKILGALALVIPGVPRKIKEFAYSGFAITVISAMIAHLATGGGAASLEPLVIFGILTASYFSYEKIEAVQAWRRRVA